MVTRLTDADRIRLERAVAAAEQRTAAELVVVIAESTAGDPRLPMLWAGLLTLLAGAVAVLVEPALPPAWIVAGEALLFPLLALLPWQPRIHLALVLPVLRRRRVAALARAQFAALGLAKTEARTGVMLFVALDARSVELLADCGIDARVAPGTWDGIVAGFLAEVRAGRLADGCLAAIEGCAAVLEQHVPRRPDDRDELPNRPVEI